MYGKLKNSRIVRKLLEPIELFGVACSVSCMDMAHAQGGCASILKYRTRQKMFLVSVQTYHLPIQGSSLSRKCQVESCSLRETECFVHISSFVFFRVTP